MINVVMYHYVRPNDQKFKYFNHFEVSKFKEQLKFLTSNYSLISRDEFKEIIEGKIINRNSFLLTFDDGFLDHYEYALPILDEMKLWGFFYIPTKVLESNKLLNVHRVHYLIGRFGAPAILDDVLKLTSSDMLDQSNIDSFDREIYKTNIHSESEYKLKRLLNYFVKYEHLESILDEVMPKYFDERELVEKVYMSERQLIELEKSGNIVGSHTVSHPVLSRLDEDMQKREIKNSFDKLSMFLKMEEKSFCYPYGYPSSYNDTTLKILSDLSVDHAFVFDNKIESAKHLKKYEISRIDCNQIGIM